MHSRHVAVSQSSHFRQKILLAKELGNELLLYDEQTHTAHCLNEVAGAIWLACAGEPCGTEVAAIVAARFPEVGVGAIVASLRELSKVGVLEELPTPETVVETVTIGRRELIRKFGITATVILPIAVTSVLIPPAAEAASCGRLGMPCSDTKPCCAPLHCLALICG